MPADRETRRVRGRFAVVLAGVGVSLVLAGLILSAPGPWTARTVSLPYAASGTEGCFYVNSSVNHDRFCLARALAPAGEALNGTFDHGPGSLAVAFDLEGGGPCASGCPTSATWTSPDGTGQVYWTFTDNVTLESRN